LFQVGTWREIRGGDYIDSGREVFAVLQGGKRVVKLRQAHFDQGENAQGEDCIKEAQPVKNQLELLNINPQYIVVVDYAYKSCENEDGLREISSCCIYAVEKQDVIDILCAEVDRVAEEMKNLIRTIFSN